MSQPRAPTSPPVRGGKPGIASEASSVSAAEIVGSGAPSTSPAGTSPVQRASSPVIVSVACECTPMNEYREREPSGSADSRTKVPGRDAASA
jgi:hypothetical protein